MCVCVCHLGAGRIQNTICAFRAHALYNPGLKPLFDEANVRQQLSKLPLQTGDLLHTLQKTICMTWRKLFFFFFLLGPLEVFQTAQGHREEHN